MAQASPQQVEEAVRAIQKSQAGEIATASRYLDQVFGFTAQLNQIPERKAAAGADARALHNLDLAANVLELAQDGTRGSLSRIRTEMAKEAAAAFVAGGNAPRTDVPPQQSRVEPDAPIKERVSNGPGKQLFGSNPALKDLNLNIALSIVGIANRAEMSLGTDGFPKVDRYLLAGETTENQQTALTALELRLKQEETTTIQEGARALGTAAGLK